MAKASKKDIDMAIELTNFVETLAKGFLPEQIANELDDDFFDIEDGEACKKVINALLAIVDKGSIGRVTWGMSIICDSENELIDPNAETIEIHPKIQRILTDRNRLLEALTALLAGDENISEATDKQLESASINSPSEIVSTQAKNVLFARQVIQEANQEFILNNGF
jgi:hypothetical protein